MRQSSLPSVVPHIGDALLVESHDITDLCFLAEDLKGLTVPQAAAVLAALHTKGVMQSLGLTFIAWLYGRKTKNPSKSAAYSYIFGNPRMLPNAQTMMDDVIRHMMTGRDKEDADSVGGFSTRELQFIANLAWAVKEQPKGAPVEDACAALEAEQTDVLQLTTRQQWEARDAEGTALALARGDITQDAVDRYLSQTKVEYDRLFGEDGELIRPRPLRKYPDDGGLKEQAREFDATFSGFKMLRDHFAPEVVVTEEPYRYGSAIVVSAPGEVADLTPAQRLDIANDAVAKHTRRKRLPMWER